MQQQSPQKIESASLSPDAVHVVFADGGESVFHFPWLLDNCPSGFHPETRERVFDLLSLPPDFAPKSARPAGGELEVEWADGRRSRFSAAWLRENAYDDAARAARRQRPTLWDAETLPEPPRFSHPAVMKSDSARLEWLTALRDYGVAMLEQVPDDMNAARQAAETIAFLRRTNFGEEFSVESKPNPNNVAYTAEELQLHTDLPNREMPPGAQFLHCLQNESEGGESVFADGFRAAEIMREEHPEDFALLTKWPLPFRFHDQDTDLRWRAETIALDAEGAVREIRYHAALTAPLDAPASVLPALYAAWRRFGELLRRPQMRMNLRLRPGEMVGFHNRRVLHGRRAFNPATGRRLLRGCYVDWDEVNSRIRVLRRGAEGLQ